ncbi:hypothetical protein [Janthinobacterium sp. PSPC1-1]|uniref:hypothetical protein n=1 Tax=Janthinobacterium sp. PSPC1-1 TaxID=2804581 RepID=UPI003CF71698
MSNSKFVTAAYAVFEDAAMPYVPDEASSLAVAGFAHAAPPPGRLEAAKRRNERALMAIDGVEGVSLGQTAIGGEALVVYLRDASVKRRVPSQVDGYPVETSITGQIDIQRW